MKGLRHLTIWICVMAAMLGMGACSRAEKDETVRENGRSYGYGISMEVMTTRPRVSWSS
mgnify:CR=1 FL=1